MHRLLVLPLLLCACGASIETGNPCEDSCQMIVDCTGGAKIGTPGRFGWYCPHTAQCGAQASCEAQCIMAASCDVVADTDRAGVVSLQGCMAACAGATSKTSDPQPAPPEPDAGAPQPKPDTKPPPCKPSCQGKQCGSDGCGGSCGTCASYLTCDAVNAACMPKTPRSCYAFNECLYVGQIKCTTANKYRKCSKGFDGCLTWDCDT